jgi:hypothetical protein
MQLLRKPSVILFTFIGFEIIKTIAAFQNVYEHAYIAWGYLLEVVILILLANLAVRGKKFALWIMGVYLLTQIGAVIFGFIIPFHEYVLKTVGIVLGSYFVYGGVILIQLARQQKRKEAEPPAADGQAAAP